MTVRRTAAKKAAITGETIIAGSKAAAKKAPARRASAFQTTGTKKDVEQATKPAATKPAPAKPPAKKAEPTGPVPFESRDWTFLQGKDPSDLHIVFAQQITMRSDVEITPKQVQAVMAMHPSFQRSKTNKARPTYSALDEAIVKQRSVHMVQAHKDAAEEIAARTAPVKKVAAKRPTKKATAQVGLKAIAEKKAAAPRKRAAK